MKLPKEEILARVSDTETEMVAYRKLATQWESMYRLDAGYRKTWQDAVTTEGREQVTLPDPYNIVLLAQRLISTKPKIEVPARGESREAIETAKRIERWLSGMWWTINKQQRNNVIQLATVQSLVRGRHVMDVRWVQDEFPAYLKRKAFPLLIRTLDPLNCGFRHGPLYTEWAYHRYYTRKFDAMQRWADAECFQNDKLKRKKKVQADDEVQITDFWYTSPVDGTIWNAVLMDDDQVLVEPFQTEYPMIPMIEGLADSSPLEPPYDSLSILQGINGLWQYKCRLMSQIGTGVLWYTWPAIFIETPMGAEIPDIEVRPGATYNVPEGTRINIPGMGMNMQPLGEMIGRIDASMQQSAFPEVLYGDGGNMQAAYGVQLLSASAKGRVKNIIENLEGSVQKVHELVLAMVEKFADADGVELYAFDDQASKTYSECLYPDDIGEFYRNIVTLRPEVPQDDVQRITMGLRLVESGVLSRESYRDKWIGGDMVAPDEEVRVWAEQAEQSPELKPQMLLMMVMKRHPKEWKQIVKGSPLEELALKLGWLKPEPPKPPPNTMPNGEPLPMPPPPNGMPPMPPGPPPMPMDGLPPGPPPGPPMPPPNGLPPGIPVNPEMMMIPPQGGGIPPEMQGMLTPETMGLPPDMNPLLFAEMMGQRPPPAEELDLLGGQ